MERSSQTGLGVIDVCSKTGPRLTIVGAQPIQNAARRSLKKEKVRHHLILLGYKANTI